MKNTLLKIAAFVLLPLVVSCAKVDLGVRPYNQEISIVPYPVHLEKHLGRFILNGSTTLAISGKGANAVSAYFADKIKASTGYTLSQSDAAQNVITITIDSAMKGDVQGYQLSVTPTDVHVKACTAQGAFYGMQSFMQLLPAEIESSKHINAQEWSVPCVVIKDVPQFVYRGVMIDVARHFLTVNDIKKQLDVMAMYKINKFHWHLTDDQGWRIEIKGYPRLTEVGSTRTELDGTINRGFYTQEQIKEVVAYAKERFIDIIPEIEMPGHGLCVLVAYPELSCMGGKFEVRCLWGVEQDVYCAGKEATFKFIEDVFAQITELFPYEYVHIGGDECPKTVWKKCPDCQHRMKTENLKSEEQLQSYFVRRAELMLNKLGRRLIGWDEILDGGISNTATVTYWRSWTGVDGVMNAIKNGNSVIMTPLSTAYLNFYQGDHVAEPLAYGALLPLEAVYNANPIPDGLEEAYYHKILGSQVNIWCEYIYDVSDFEYMAYPRVLALAEQTWTPLGEKAFARFSASMDNQTMRLSFHQINYHIPLPEGPIANDVKFMDSVSLKFHNSRNYPMYYTLDETIPTTRSEKYVLPITISRDCVLNIATIASNGKVGLRRLTIQRDAYTPAVDVQTEPGVKRTLVDGLLMSLADLKTAPKGTPEVIPEFAFTFNGEKSGGGAIYEGYVDLPVTGVYTFASDMDLVTIDGDSLLINDGRLTMHQITRAAKALCRGKHKIGVCLTNTPYAGRPKCWDKVGVMYQVDTLPLSWINHAILSH